MKNSACRSGESRLKMSTTDKESISQTIIVNNNSDNMFKFKKPNEAESEMSCEATATDNSLSNSQDFPWLKRSKKTTNKRKSSAMKTKNEFMEENIVLKNEIEELKKQVDDLIKKLNCPTKIPNNKHRETENNSQREIQLEIELENNRANTETKNNNVSQQFLTAEASNNDLEENEFTQELRKKNIMQQQKLRTNKQKQFNQNLVVDKVNDYVQSPNTHYTSPEISRDELNHEQNTTETGTKKNNIYKQKKLPPINTIGQEPKDLIRIITDNLKINKNDFYIKKISAQKYAIYMNNLENYNKTKLALENIQANYYSYTPEEEKVKTLVLKGLHEKENCDDILENLQINKPTKVNFVKVTRLITKQSQKLNKTLPIYLVQIAPNSILKEIYNIKHLNNQVITWEKLNKNEILQCKRCQRLGHAAPNCRLQYRCVKCENAHNPGECTIKKNKENQNNVYCVLCKSYGHPASYRGCIKYLQRKQDLLEKKNISRDKISQKTTIFNNYLEPNKTFAEKLKNNNMQTPTKIEKIPQIDTNQLNATLTAISNQLKSFDQILKENTRRINVLYQLLPSNE